MQEGRRREHGGKGKVGRNWAERREMVEEERVRLEEKEMAEDRENEV